MREPYRAERKLQAGPDAPISATTRDAPLDQLFIRDGPRCWFVPLREVSLFTSDGNCVRLLWGNERPLLGRSLLSLEAKLDPQRYLVHSPTQTAPSPFFSMCPTPGNGK